MRLKPKPATEKQPRQFWKDFIRDTMSQFGKPMIEKLETFVKQEGDRRRQLVNAPFERRRIFILFASNSLATDGYSNRIESNLRQHRGYRGETQ